MASPVEMTTLKNCFITLLPVKVALLVEWYANAMPTYKCSLPRKSQELHRSRSENCLGAGAGNRTARQSIRDPGGGICARRDRACAPGQAWGSFHKAGHRDRALKGQASGVKLRPPRKGTSSPET